MRPFKYGGCYGGSPGIMIRKDIILSSKYYHFSEGVGGIFRENSVLLIVSSGVHLDLML